jgi:hypothetical protein
MSQPPEGNIPSPPPGSYDYYGDYHYWHYGDVPRGHGLPTEDPASDPYRTVWDDLLTPSDAWMFA